MVGHHRHHNGSQEAAHDEQRTDQRVTVGGHHSPDRAQNTACESQRETDRMTAYSIGAHARTLWRAVSGSGWAVNSSKGTSPSALSVTASTASDLRLLSFSSARSPSRTVLRIFELRQGASA